MTQARNELFAENLVDLADFATALSHPARISIVTYLQEKQWTSCGEIVRSLPLAQATVSQHIRMLLDAGLLLQRPDGRKMYYLLNCQKMKDFCHHFQCTLGTQTPES